MGLPHSGSELSLIPRPVWKTRASLAMRTSLIYQVQTTGVRYLHIPVAVKCFVSSCIPLSVLAQIFLHDVKNMQMKFNPRRGDFIKLVSPHLPTVEQLATVAEDKSTLQLCKTGMHCLVTIVISFSCFNKESKVCYQCHLSLPLCWIPIFLLWW